ncbi:MAG: hypothetical protein LBH36_03190 [Candidatus Nomurabacteria bacterium]|jgi:hypothetical protein|nr:hypothetical protein [Candidatus Nomurabacteria bacterium]
MAAMKGFDELLRRIKDSGVEKIEMGARESTSYRIFTSTWGQRYLTKNGFRLVDHGETDNFGSGERTFLLSLEKIL